MKRTNIYFLALVIMLFPLTAGHTQEIDGSILARLTTVDNKTIPPQQYLSKDIALKKPFVVKGKVTDKGGEAIPSVKVNITQLMDYQSFQSTTDNDGIYQIELSSNETATTYKLSIEFLSGEFEFDSNKIFAEKAYQVSSKYPSSYRTSDTLCMNELIYLANKNSNPKEEKVRLVINIAHQKESILTKKPEESAMDVINHIIPSIPTSIKERLIARFEEMRKIKPEEVKYFEALGLLQYELRAIPERNYRDAAINRFRTAIKIGSANMEVHYDLIDLLSEAGYYGESIQIAVRALQLIGDDASKFNMKQDFQWFIRRAQFNFAEKEKEKKLTEEELKLRNDWSLKLLEDQREVYRQEGFPSEIKKYDRKEGTQEEWWYYNKGICYVFLNGMLNTKREF